MTVAERLVAVLRTVFDDDTLVVTDETTAREIDAWDSLGHISLMFSIEQEFGIRFRDDQMTGFSNVGELRRLLEEHERRS